MGRQDPIANLHPECTWTWKSGYQKSCIIYDFDNCATPTWPTACPVLSRGSSNGCIKYWCPNESGFGGSTSSTSTDEGSLLKPPNISRAPEPLDFPWATVCAIFVPGIMALLSFVVWHKILNNYQRYRVSQNALELKNLLVRVGWCLSPLFVCLLFPLILFASLLYFVCHEYIRKPLRSRWLDSRKRSDSWGEANTDQGSAQKALKRHRLELQQRREKLEADQRRLARQERIQGTLPQAQGTSPQGTSPFDLALRSLPASPDQGHFSGFHSTFAASPHQANLAAPPHQANLPTSSGQAFPSKSYVAIDMPDETLHLPSAPNHEPEPEPSDNSFTTLIKNNLVYLTGGKDRNRLWRSTVVEDSKSPSPAPAAAVAPQPSPSGLCRGPSGQNRLYPTISKKDLEDADAIVAGDPNVYVPTSNFKSKFARDVVAQERSNSLVNDLSGLNTTFFHQAEIHSSTPTEVSLDDGEAWETALSDFNNSSRVPGSITREYEAMQARLTAIRETRARSQSESFADGTGGGTLNELVHQLCRVSPPRRNDAEASRLQTISENTELNLTPAARSVRESYSFIYSLSRISKNNG